MHKRLRTIITTLEELRAQIKHAEVGAPAISAWSVGQQLDHALKANAAILHLVRLDSTNTPVARGISIIGRLSLLTTWIPRGQGKTPEKLYPQTVDETALVAQIDQLIIAIRTLEPDLPAIRRNPHRYAHPVFGGLSKWQWLAFIEVHQRHHLKIIRDIVRARRQ